MSKTNVKTLPLMGMICNARRVLDSFRPISVNQILEDIRIGIYRRPVEQIRLHRLVKNYDLAQQYVDTLPIIYPGAECPDVDHETEVRLNGLVVVALIDDAAVNCPLQRGQWVVACVSLLKYDSQREPGHQTVQMYLDRYVIVDDISKL